MLEFSLQAGRADVVRRREFGSLAEPVGVQTFFGINSGRLKPELQRRNQVTRDEGNTNSKNVGIFGKSRGILA